MTVGISVAFQEVPGPYHPSEACAHPWIDAPLSPSVSSGGDHDLRAAGDVDLAGGARGTDLDEVLSAANEGPPTLRQDSVDP